METKRVGRAVLAIAAGIGIAAAASAVAGAGAGVISGSANWSAPTAEEGQTVTLSGGYQNDTAGAATFAVQLNVAGASSQVITSFSSSPNLTGCALGAGNIIACTWNATAQGDTASIAATVVVPSGSVGQAWQGDASANNMGLGTDILEIVAPTPTTATTTTTAPTVPGEPATTVEETTTTAAAAGGGTATTRPRSSALPATGSSSPELAIAAAFLVLAGGAIVIGTRRRQAD